MQGFQVANGDQQFLDQNGHPLIGGFVYHYLPGTTTPLTTYQDPALTTPNTNPIILDGAGRAVIWGNSFYRQIVTDQMGNLQWDQVVGGAPAALSQITEASATFLTGDQTFTSVSPTSIKFDTNSNGILTFSAFQFQSRKVEVSLTLLLQATSSGAVVESQITVQVSYDGGATWNSVGATLVEGTSPSSFPVFLSFIETGNSVPLIPTPILYRTVLEVLMQSNNPSVVVLCGTLVHDAAYSMQVSNINGVIQG